MRFSITLLATMVASMVGTGCGEDGDGATGDQTFGELSPAQVTSVCKSVQTKMERVEKAFISITCTEEALFDEETCTAERKSCIADPPEEGTLGVEADFDCAADSQESVSSDCPKLTVSQLQGCLEAVAKSFEATAAAFTCSSDPETLEPPPTPKACRDLEPVCPMLADFGA